MDKETFFDRLLGHLRNDKELQELDSVHDALIYWVGVNYFGLDTVDVKDRIVIDKHAEGIDAVFVDQNGYNIIFVQAQSVDNFSNTLNNYPENNVKSTLAGVEFLTVGDYKSKITPKLENLVDEYHDLQKTGEYNVQILFLTLKQKPTDEKYIQEFRIKFPQINVEFLDFDRLYDYYTNRYVYSVPIPPPRVSIEMKSAVLKKDSPRKARVFTCNARELARIYDEYGERIFQQNVRYLLGLRTRGINRQILETAAEEARSKDFWYFNNGITMICRQIIEPPNRRTIILEDAQVINGAQTTYALHDAYTQGRLKEDVEIIVKVIETTDREFMENVTLYTNSQNAIKLRDLSSNDSIQIKVQKVLDSYGYFYERKRGEFEVSYPTRDAKINRFGHDYKEKLLSNENAAQAFLALYLDKPAQAKSEKGRVFLKEIGGFYNDIFKRNDEFLPEKLYIAWKLLKFIENGKKEYGQEYKKAEEKSTEEQKQTYRFDFLLHSEYFILNLFRDFLKNASIDLMGKTDIMKLDKMIDEQSSTVGEIYDKTTYALADYIDELRYTPRYYHNKFFKSEKSIGLVRNFFKKRFDFVEVIV